MNTIVIMNEQHSLLPSQEKAVVEQFGEFSFKKVPAEGWTLEEINQAVTSLVGEDYDAYVVLSPIPVLLGSLSGIASDCGFAVWVFHNDVRVAKEVPDGNGGTKLIHVVSPEGWQLVRVA